MRDKQRKRRSGKMRHVGRLDRSTSTTTTHTQTDTKTFTKSKTKSKSKTKTMTDTFNLKMKDKQWESYLNSKLRKGETISQDKNKHDKSTYQQHKNKESNSIEMNIKMHDNNVKKHWFDVFITGEQFITPQIPSLKMLEEHRAFSKQMKKYSMKTPTLKAEATKDKTSKNSKNSKNKSNNVNQNTNSRSGKLTLSIPSLKLTPLNSTSTNDTSKKNCKEKSKISDKDLDSNGSGSQSPSLKPLAPFPPLQLTSDGGILSDTDEFDNQKQQHVQKIPATPSPPTTPPQTHREEIAGNVEQMAPEAQLKLVAQMSSSTNFSINIENVDSDVEMVNLPVMEPILENKLYSISNTGDIDTNQIGNVNDRKKQDGRITYHDIKFHVLQMRKEQIVRRSIIIGVSLMFIIFGIGLIVYIVEHFSYAYSVCINKQFDGFEDENDNDMHNELYVWNDCNFKVYPLMFDYNGKYMPCNCRQLIIDETEFTKIFINSNMTQKIQTQTIMDVFRYWYMLETIKIEGSSGNTVKINFTSDMFDSIKLRVIDFSHININTFDENIQYWIQMEYLRFSNCQIGNFPNNSMINLKRIQYLDLHFAIFMTQLDWICWLNELQYIILTGAPIINMPYCFYDGSMTQLQKLQLVGITSVGENSDQRQFIKIFENPNLVEFNSVGVPTLDYDDFPNNSVNNGYFYWNNDTIYYLQGTELCDAYTYEYNWLRTNYSKYLVDFLDETNACQYYCNTIVETRYISCLPADFNNGGMCFVPLHIDITLIVFTIIDTT